MLENNATNYPPEKKGSVIAIPETYLRSSIQVLNRVIIELRKTEMNIEKIAFFEEPLEAIVHINNAPVETRPSWLQKVRNFNRPKISPVRVKLNVTKAPHVQDLFLLKYETLSREV